MRVRLAKSAGFCMGVRRAMDIVFDAINEKERIYTYGPIVHNPQAIEMLHSKGVKVVDDLDEKLLGTIVIRAHGISPEKRKQLQQNGLKILDATCPRVMKVQNIIQIQAKEGYHIVIIGDREHPEVIGLLGFSQKKGMVVSTVEDVQQLPSNIDKVCVVAQTTQDVTTFKDISERIRENFPIVRIFNTICDSTSKRQQEVIHLADKVDGLVVIGGKNSGNTQRLVKIAESTGTLTLHVETEDELDIEKLADLNTIGITAGASTPSWMINRVVGRIERIQKREMPLLLRVWSNIWRVLIKGNVYIVFGAGCLSYVSCLLQGIAPEPSFILIASLYVFSMHTLYYFTDKEAARFNDPHRAEFYERYGEIFTVCIIFSMLVSLYLSFLIGEKVFFFLIMISLPGLIYGVKIRPPGLSRIFQYKRLKDIPGSKTLFIALAWGAVTSVLPALSVNWTKYPSTVIAFLFVVILVFLRSALFDITDIQGDRIVGKETIPILIGEDKTKAMLKFLAGVLFLTLLFSALFGVVTSLGYLLLACPLYGYGYVRIYEKKAVSPGVLLESIVESNFALALFVSFLWLFFFS